MLIGECIGGSRTPKRYETKDKGKRKLLIANRTLVIMKTQKGSKKQNYHPQESHFSSDTRNPGNSLPSAHAIKASAKSSGA